MLKKLKIRLILHNLLILGIVFILLFAALLFFIYIREEIKLTNDLNKTMDIALANPSPPFANVVEVDNKIYKISFVVLLNKAENIISSTQTHLDKKSIKDAVEFALDSESERGNYRNLGVSFIRGVTPNGVVISFLSREHLNDSLKEIFLQGMIAGLVFMLISVLMSIHFANMAVAPVEKAWEQQKQFLADASHDLKTPLTVILANNNIVASHRDQTVESQMKWIESTNEEAGRMTELVNKMLELAKSEATKDELRIGEIDLSELVENSILQFEVVAFEKNISIESGIQPNMIARTHGPTFSKVLEILFDNAIKYSEENGKISIALYQSGKKIYFTINNRGEYIKPEEIPHVFERFYRTNKERNIDGHGLGLSIAKKKCDMLGCKLTVESNEDDGTTFTIILKAKKK